MSRYAETTGVSVANTRAEIEKTLMRYGADGFIYGWEGNRALVGFRMKGRHIRFSVAIPSLDDLAHTPTGKARSADKRVVARDQATKQRWRALLLIIKAKLEAVESGITEFEDEFLAHIVLPDGKTAGDWLKPQIAAAYETGNMPKLLPGPQ